MQKYTLVLLVVALCAPLLLANRENRGSRQSQKQRACNYQWSECKLREGATCGTGKKTGTSESADCPRKQIEKKCKVKCATAEAGSSKTRGGAASCKYKSPPSDSAAPCDPHTNTQTVIQTLTASSPATCQPTMSIQKPCPRKNKQRVPRALDDEEDMEVGGDARCKYRRGQKGECNAVTKKRTITMTLKRKSPASCAPTKTVEKPCKVKAPKQDKAKQNARRPNRRRQDQDQ